MFFTKTTKPVLVVFCTLLLFPLSAYCDDTFSGLLGRMIQKCFEDPDSGYANKKITGLKQWMTNIQKTSADDAAKNDVVISGFTSYKFKWKLIDNPKNEWHDDQAIFYILVKHGQLKFSKGFRPATCEYTQLLDDPKAELHRKKPAAKAKPETKPEEQATAP
jgi:hypothetical protein